MSKKQLMWLVLALCLVAVGSLAFVMAFVLTPPPAASTTLSVQAPSGLPPALVQPSGPKCVDVFVPSKVIDIKGADFACVDPDGTMNFLAAFRCNDGRHLWQVDAAAGPPAGYGFSGEPYQKTTTNGTASDPGYSRAYDKCHS